MKDDPDTNIEFVKMIEKNPCVFNRRCRSYSNKEKQKEAWEKIGREFDASVSECKERWKNLRSCFTRDLKLQSSPGYCAMNKKPYYLAQHLKFLRPFTKSRSRPVRFQQSSSHEYHDEKESLQEKLSEFKNEPTFNMDDIDPESSDTNLSQDNDICSLNHTPIKGTINPKRMDLEERKTNVLKDLSKRRKPNTIQIDNDSDELDLCFFKSLLPDLRQMNPEQKRNFKIGVIKLSGTILNQENAHSSFSGYRNVKKDGSGDIIMHLGTRKINHENGRLSRLRKKVISKQGKEHLEQDEIPSTTNNGRFLGSHDMGSHADLALSTLSSDSSVIEYKVDTEDLDHLIHEDDRSN